MILLQNTEGSHDADRRGDRRKHQQRHLNPPIRLNRRRQHPRRVVVLPSPTSTPFTTLPTLDPIQATAAAQETQAAALGGGITPTATALPSTGFADEIGVPMLAMLGGVFLLALILARGLRISTQKKIGYHREDS